MRETERTRVNLIKASHKGQRTTNPRMRQYGSRRVYCEFLWTAAAAVQ